MKYFKIFLIFCLFFSISACSLKKDTENEDDWENEVLLASACGMDGLQCCLPPEKECKYGQECCHDPSDPNLNYCADDCTLGFEGSFCRLEDPKCDKGFACDNNRCVSCGSEEAPCCYEKNGEAKCEDDLVCSKNNICEQCGLPGNICCEGDKSCLNENLFQKGRTECQNNICSYCGYGGAIACGNEPFCNKGHLFNNQNCLQCGNLNQPCCKIDNFNLSECDKEQDLECKLGFCTKNK